MSCILVSCVFCADIENLFRACQAGRMTSAGYSIRTRRSTRRGTRNTARSSYRELLLFILLREREMVVDGAVCRTTFALSYGLSFASITATVRDPKPRYLMDVSFICIFQHADRTRYVVLPKAHPISPLKVPDRTTRHSRAAHGALSSRFVISFVEHILEHLTPPLDIFRPRSSFASACCTTVPEWW